MKKIFVYVKRLILGIFVLYGYNLVAVNFNMIIPVNVFTIILIGILGFPALFALIIFKVLIL